MLKNRILNTIFIYILAFAISFIVIRGIGIWEFEKNECDITQLTGTSIEMEGEYSCMSMDFSTIDSDKAIYGVELNIRNIADVGEIRVSYRESSDDNWQDLMVERHKDNVTILFTKSRGHLKLYTDKALEITAVSLITRAGMGITFVVAGVIAAVLCVMYLFGKKTSGEARMNFSKAKALFADRRVMVTLAIVVAETGIISCLEWGHCVLAQGAHFNPCRVFMLICIAFLGTVIVRHKDLIVKYFHIFYFVLVLITGTVYIVGLEPYSLDLSWDDQIHYARANYIARGFRSYETEAGYQLKNHFFDRATFGENYVKDKRLELASYIKSIDNNEDYGGLRYVESYHYSNLTTVAYIPSAIGLIVGRGLGMSTMMTLIMGRWTNVLFYALILSCAVWLLRKRGYIIAAFIGMIPIAVYISGNYTYDHWVTALTILGYALLADYLEKREDNINTSPLKMIIVMCLAVMPKAVYLTLMIPMIVTFAAKGKKNGKILLVSLLAFILLAMTFVLPVILSGGALYTDLRGGSEVNSAEQIRFILTKPLQYFMILARFLWRYLNPDNSVEAFAYYLFFGGTGKYFSVVLTLLVVGIMTDSAGYSREDSGKVMMMRAWNAIGILATLVLVSTAMYVSYTPVMSKEIAGVHSRYIMPVLFPMMFYVLRVNIDIPKNIKDSVAIYGSFIMSLVLCFNIYVQAICFY